MKYKVSYAIVLPQGEKKINLTGCILTAIGSIFIYTFHVEIEFLLIIYMLRSWGSGYC